MRTLGFACRENPGSGDDLAEEAKELVWLGFTAIADPVRPDVPAAVANCRRAGIRVKVVTGDNPETAREIGRQIHLWEAGESEEGTVMTGLEFAALDETQTLEAAKRLRIMARARPNDKLKLVRALRASGEVVAVTGDGTNDAPALNNADVGIAMGKTGTSVAKEASDIILLDDSFSSIVNAVMWGRSLYRNIQRFLLFQLTVNVVALTIAMSGPFLGIDLPLTVIQMLWVNLIMDTFAALALATEPPDPKVMEQPPRRNSAFIVTPAMWRGIFGGGIVFLAVLVALLLRIRGLGLEAGSAAESHQLTVFFCVFVLLQFWNLFNAKCFGTGESIFRHLANNRAFLAIAAGILIGQILMVQFGGKVFRTDPLNFMEWTAIIAGTSLILWGRELFRVCFRKQS
jgi:Ca2+-transporting ATPase